MKKIIKNGATVCGYCIQMNHPFNRPSHLRILLMTGLVRLERKLTEKYRYIKNIDI